MWKIKTIFHDLDEYHSWVGVECETEEEARSLLQCALNCSPNSDRKTVNFYYRDELLEKYELGRGS